MAVEEIKGDEYTISYNSIEHSVAFGGTIRLQTSEDYAPITDLLQKAHTEAGMTLILDFRGLQFLNSAGINTVSKFVIACRKDDRVVLAIKGNKDIYWQQKSLQNMQKLWPKVTIEII